MKRLPGELIWILAWVAALAGVSLYASAYADPGPPTAWLAGLGGLYLLILLGLARLRPWARVLGGGVLFLGAVGAGLKLVGAGFSGTRLAILLFQAWAAGYLLSGSTREVFRAGANRGRISLQNVAPILLLLAAVGVVSLLPLGHDALLVLAIALLCAYFLFFEERVNRTLALLLAPRPRALDRSAWRVFKQARAARLRGDLDGAEAALATLPPEPAVETLRGLVAVDRARTGGGLNRIVLDASYVPPAHDAAAITTSCRSDLEGQLLARPVAARAALIDLLLADAHDPRSCFALEFEEAMDRLTGQVFGTNAEERFRAWWSETRERATGLRALEWLSARLWGARCLDAAEAVALQSGDLPLAEATVVARVLSQATHATDDAWSEGWLEQHDHRLALLPSLTDGLGWFHLDGSFLGRHGIAGVAEVFEQRRALVDRLRALWSDYPTESELEVIWLLHLLTGSPVRVVRARSRFEAWWGERAPARAEYERAFLEGLRAAQEEVWEVAEAAFRRASEAEPERTAAACNRASALMRLERFAEAEAVFRRLVALDREDASWWLRLGDCRRMQGKLQEAVRAYAVVLQLEGLEDRIALRLGVTLAADGHEAQAETFLDAALGKAANPELLEELAAMLEAEGAYDLAARYGRRAFLEGLGRPEDWADDGDEPEGDEPLLS